MDSKKLQSLNCNILLVGTNLKLYCRECINTIKDARIDKHANDMTRCRTCRCYKTKETCRNILLTCKTCRTRKDKPNKKHICTEDRKYNE